jgi:hypothetical protein
VRDFSATTTASARAPARGHADGLHRAHAGAHQHAGHVGGAGEVVGDDAEDHAHPSSPAASMPVSAA